LDARGRGSTASNARSRHENPRDRTKAKTDSVSSSHAKNCPEQTRSGTEGEGEMNANQFFKSEWKPVFHWFLLALLVFTIIDYLFVLR
jgi:hypothetical protein